MEKRTGTLITWFAATTIAVLVATAAIGQVEHQVRLEPPPAPLIAAAADPDMPLSDVGMPSSEEEGDEGEDTPSVSDPVPVGPDDPSPDPSTPGGSGHDPDGADDPGLPAPGRPDAPDTPRSDAAAPSGSPPSSSSTTAAEAEHSSEAEAPPETGTGDGAAAEESAPAPAPETRSYELTGGSVSVRFDGDQVEVLWAVPRAGFSVDVERSPDGSEASVRFRNDDHRSRLKVSAERGRYRDEIEERDR